MIISRSQIQRTVSIYAREQNRSQKPNRANSRQLDQVSLSSSSREVQAVTEQLVKQPDVRSSLVNSLREEIRQGTYNPDCQEVAAKLLGRFTVDRLV